MNAPDFYNLIAKSRGVPDGWRWFELKAVGDIRDRPNGGVLIRGAICTAVFKSGPRKGQINWSKRTDERELLVSMKEYDAFVAQWEIDTGLCSKCGGDGQELAGCSTTGSTYRPCKQCGATGKMAA